MRATAGKLADTASQSSFETDPRPLWRVQQIKSASSMFQQVRSRTKVPRLRRASNNPFAASPLMASRSAVRLTPRL